MYQAHFTHMDPKWFWGQTKKEDKYTMKKPATLYKAWSQTLYQVFVLTELTVSKDLFSSG